MCFDAFGRGHVTLRVGACPHSALDYRNITLTKNTPKGIARHRYLKENNTLITFQVRFCDFIL
jgi:hypothetical protein